MNFSVLFLLLGCHHSKQLDVSNEMIKTFTTEIEQFVWLNFQGNQPMTLSIRCTFGPLNRQCYLGSSNDHPITIDDTRLGLPLSEQQMPDGWVTVEGVWKPESDALLIDQVDLRVDKVLIAPPTPLVVMLQ